MSIPSSVTPSPQRSLQAHVVDDEGRLGELAPAWDELACASGCPGALSGWQLAWWRACAPTGAELRAVVVRDGERLVGVAPYWVVPKRRGPAVYRLLASTMTHRIEPVADPELVEPVASEIASALASANPAPAYVAFEAADARSRWRIALAGHWPGSTPHTLHERSTPAPVLQLPGTFDEWLGGKSRNFRQQTRRLRRRLDEAGGRTRFSSLDELDSDIDAFVRLHHLRWEGRGGSSLSDGIGDMLRAAGRDLLPSGRLRLSVVEVGDRPASVQIFLAAGGEVLYWNGGFDPDLAHLKPALVGILAGLENSIDRGERRLDFGGGAHDYKLRVADGDMPLTWEGLVPRDRRYLRNRVSLLPRQAGKAGRAGFGRLPPGLQQRIRAARASER
jgi:CelD/BcsL family acetyltransferase involved in cellulose biosynthesis